MDDTITALEVGTAVHVREDLPGAITAICIRGHRHLTYEVGWWDGNEYREAWFHESQIIAIFKAPRLKTIGFVTRE